MSRISDNCPVQKTTPRQGLWWRWLRLQLRKENEEGKESEEFSSPLPLPVEPSTTQRPAGVSRLATARRSLGISVRSIVHAAIRLSKPAETVQVDENEGSELRVPFHRNVSDTQCSPESDIISKMAEGSTQRLALRQFSSNFKYLQETNDERKRSSAAFFTGVADSSRSLTGATPQCLKRDLNSDSRRTSFDTVSESAAQPPPHQSITRARSNSGKGAMSVDHLNGNNESFRQQNLSRGNSFRNNADSRRGSRQLGARGASLRSINSIASVATIKDLQEVTDPYFCDMPRAPSLRECFKSSAAIRESAGAVTNKNSTGNELELAVSTTLTESHPRFNAGELTGSPRGIFRMSAPTLNVASIVDEHAQWGNTLSVSADSSVDALGQGGYTTLQNDMAASFGAGLRMGCITAGNRRASVSCTLSAFKGASGASRRGSEGCIPTHNSIPFPSTPALTTNNMPSDDICVSESGTVTVGGWKIRESGMRRASEDLTAVPLSRDPSSAGISVNEGKVRDRARRLDFLEVGIIGSGASGNVLEALHIPTLTVVAIKVLPVYQIDKLQSIARELSVLYTNLTELSLISTALDSDNNEDKHMTLGRGKPKCLHVLALYDAFTDLNSGCVHLVVEYMDGGSLQDIVDNGGCREEQVLADIAFQAMDGLAYLHSHKRIHRDIKPGNILLNTKGEVKIADFGITKVLNDTRGTKSFVGTQCYMAPERIISDLYSFQSDVWSLGLTILAVSCGQFPLSKDARGGYWELLKVICEDSPPTPGPLFSVQYNEFIAACLVRDATVRRLPADLLDSETGDSFLLRGREINVKISQEDAVAALLSRATSLSDANSCSQSSRDDGADELSQMLAKFGSSSLSNPRDLVDSITAEENGFTSVLLGTGPVPSPLAVIGALRPWEVKQRSISKRPSRRATAPALEGSDTAQILPISPMKLLKISSVLPHGDLPSEKPSSFEEQRGTLDRRCSGSDRFSNVPPALQRKTMDLAAGVVTSTGLMLSLYPYGSGSSKDQMHKLAASDIDFMRAVDTLREHHLICIMQCLHDKCHIEEYASVQELVNNRHVAKTIASLDKEGSDPSASSAPPGLSTSLLPLQVPGFDSTYMPQWRLFAAQMLLPTSVVIKLTTSIIAKKYFINNCTNCTDDEEENKCNLRP